MLVRTEPSGRTSVSPITSPLVPMVRVPMTLPSASTISILVRPAASVAIWVDVPSDGALAGPP